MGGVTVYSRDGQLRYLAPPGTLTPELRTAAAVHGDVLVRICRAADAALDRAFNDEHRRAIAKARHATAQERDDLEAAA